MSARGRRSPPRENLSKTGWSCLGQHSVNTGRLIQAPNQQAPNTNKPKEKN
jgi:hypothetical protein